MPARVTKLKGGRVRQTWGGKVVAKRTTASKAKRQRRLLGAIKHNPNFKRRRQGRRRR